MVNTAISTKNLEKKLAEVGAENSLLKMELEQLKIEKRALINKLAVVPSVADSQKRAFRHGLVSIILISTPQLEDAIHGVAYNISMTGMKLEIKQEFAIGEELTVGFPSFQYQAQIVWKKDCTPLKNIPLWEHGLKFISFTSREKQTLEIILKIISSKNNF